MKAAPDHKDPGPSSMSKKSEFQTVGDGVLDVPAVTAYLLTQFSAKSQHFQTGRPGGRPLHGGSSAVRGPAAAFVAMTGRYPEKIVSGKSFQYPKKAKYNRMFMQNVQV